MRLRYHRLARDAAAERDFEPRRLTYSGGAWYLDAYCRLRQDQRGFRLDRIDALDLLTETFQERPTAPSEQPARRGSIRVRVLLEGRSAAA